MSTPRADGSLLGKLFPWLFGVAFTGIATLVLLLLGTSLTGSGDEMLARLQAARRATGNAERLATGTVRLPDGAAPLKAPGSQTPCVAWDLQVNVEWPDADANGREETKSRSLLHGAAATAFELVDQRDRVTAYVDERRLDLRAEGRITRSGELPAWTQVLKDHPKGADSTHDRRTYAVQETLLVPGDTVTVLGVQRGLKAEQLVPTAKDGLLFVYRGTPKALEAQAALEGTAGRWLTRGGAVTGVLTLIFAVGLVRALRRKR